MAMFLQYRFVLFISPEIVTQINATVSAAVLAQPEMER
jgi:hypothetical protein